MTFSWTQKSGYSIGSFPERIAVDVPLPVNDTYGISYTIIAGSLPPGLIIERNSITGIPFIVATDTVFSFCIRASDGVSISDRTYNITITGSNPPEFVIQDTNLDIGPAYQYFAIDHTYIRYQLKAINLTVALNKEISYFITEGRLPPGLTLSKSGLISGVVKVLTPDFPDVLTSNYVFKVLITDGILVSTKTYSIYIVGPEYLGSDNEVLRDANHLFTADVTPLRPIQWVTPSNLGTFRANNFITTFIETVDTTNLQYIIGNQNALPPGTSFNSTTGVISGYMPFQAAVEISYTFSITAIRTNPLTNESVESTKLFTMQVIGEVDSVITWGTTGGYGAVLVAELGYDNPHGLPKSDQILSIQVINGGTGYTTNPEIVIIPTNGGVNAMATCTISNGSIDRVTVTYPGSGYLTAPRVNVAQNLGTVDLNAPSTISVKAYSSIANAVLTYAITDGQLPPGLSLSQNGEVIGKIHQYATFFDPLISSLYNEPTTYDNSSTSFTGITFDQYIPVVDEPGLTDFYHDPTTFDGGNTSFTGLTFDQNTQSLFDNGTTVFDRVFAFTVTATDRYGSSSHSFSITIGEVNNEPRSNITVKPMLTKIQRGIWSDFINNPTVFTLSSLYRPNDENFGLHSDLSMLIFAGIETSSIDTYVNAIEKNHKRKRLLFGDITSAVAIDPYTHESVYEVIYIKMIDPLEPNVSSLPLEITYNQVTYYPNSITNWQTRLSEAVDSENHVLTNDQTFLPLWMRSVDQSTGQKPGFVLGVPLCYCKIGTSSNIILNINNYIKTTGFSFNDIDYTIERYTIDTTTPDTGAKYIVFNNERTTI